MELCLHQLETEQMFQSIKYVWIDTLCSVDHVTQGVVNKKL